MKRPRATCDGCSIGNQRAAWVVTLSFASTKRCGAIPPTTATESSCGRSSRPRTRESSGVQMPERLVPPSDASPVKTDSPSLINPSGPIDEPTARAAIRGLSTVAPGHSVWFTTMDRSEGSDDYYRALRGLFVEAGWVVRREDRVPFPLKPGLFLFAADERPPSDVIAIRAALMKAGINITFNSAYRAYYEEMKRTRPAWNGIAMSPDQPFTVVVGPLKSGVSR